MSKISKEQRPASPTLPGGSCWILLLIAAAAILPYLSALTHDFVFDDRHVIGENPAVTRFDLHALWTQPYWPNKATTNIYRPLTSTTYAIDWAIGHGKPGGFVAANLLLHLAATILAWSLVRRLFPSRPEIAALTALLFAVHPLHVEAVVGIVGRAELLAAILCLLAYRFWLDAERDGSTWRGLVSAALWFLALLAKESAVGLPLLLLAHRMGVLAPASHARRPRRADIAWPAVVLAVLALRVHAIGSLATPRTWWIDNPLAPLDPLRRALGAGGVLARQALQIVTGGGLSADYSYAGVVPGAGLYVAGAVALVLLGAATAWALTRGRARTAGWGIVFFLAFWVVTSNLLVPIGTVQADRLLYLPLLGLSAGIVAVLVQLAGRRLPSYLLPALLAVAVAGFGVRSALRTRDWKSERTLFESAVRTVPGCIKARVNLAGVYLYPPTPQAARRALDILRPVEREARTFGTYLLCQAKATAMLGDRARARDLFRAGLATGGDSAETLVELGNLALMDRNGQDALQSFNAAARTGRLRENVAIGRASALSVLGRYGEAADAWLPIVTALPDSVPLRAACARNLTDAGRAAEAARLLREGLARREDPRLELTLAHALLAGAGTAREALQATARAAETAPTKELLTALAIAQIRAGERGAAVATRARVSDPVLLAKIDAALAAGGASP